MKHRLTTQAAATMAEEERTLTCATCDDPTPRDGEKYCRSCAAYWKDVEEGLFDEHHQRRIDHE